MIETIRMLGLSLCVTAVITAIFTMLMPDAKLEKTVKFAISLFFLTGLAAPFAAGELDPIFDFSPIQAESQASPLEKQAQEQFLSLAERNLEASLEQLLRAEGVRPQKVDVSIHITEDQRVSIKQVRVTLPASEEGNRQKAADLLRKETGTEAEVDVI